MAFYQIVSLYPAGTDLLAELGLQSRIIACSHRCDLPDTLDKLPRVTRPSKRRLAPVLDPVADKPELQTAQHMADALCLGDQLDLDTLRLLSPDLIVGRGDPTQQTLLESKLQEIWGAATPKTLQFNPRTLAEAEEALQELAEQMGHGPRAARLLEQVHTRRKILAEKVQETDTRPSVAVVNGLNPVSLQAGWLPELLEQAAGTPVNVTPGQPDRYTTWLDLAAADPDKLILAMDNATLEDDDRLVNQLHQENDLRTLRAFRAKQVFFVDARRLTQRAGLKLDLSLQTLAEIIHPEKVGTKLLGTTWSEYF